MNFKVAVMLIIGRAASRKIFVSFLIFYARLSPVKILWIKAVMSGAIKTHRLIA